MQIHRKEHFPPEKTRQLLEPGPVILVSSAYQEQRDIMAMGWYMMMGYTLVGCYIWSQNDSHALIRNSGECVINLPTLNMISAVIGIGNSHASELGSGMDKFDKFALTSVTGEKVSAPLVAECYANFECKLVDDTLIDRYGLFVFEVVKAHKALHPVYPKTIHYRGGGKFMLAGDTVDYSKRFNTPQTKRENHNSSSI